jgi:uncharacterized membrane protein
MNTLYNRVAGQSLERLAALSDGVFAIAMTLLVLDLRLPAGEDIHNEHELWASLVALSPRLIAYLMSFLTLGIFWLGQQAQLSQYTHSDRNLTWINLGFLLTVSVLPFSTGLLAEFMGYRVALIIYWVNLLLLGVWLFSTRRYAHRAGLIKEEVGAAMRAAMERRIVVLQAMYAVGAALCVFNTYLSVAVIMLTQLYSVLTPVLSRLAGAIPGSRR